VGGTTYLAQLLTAMVGIINAREYGDLIQKLWMRRQAISHRRRAGQLRLRRHFRIPGDRVRIRRGDRQSVYNRGSRRGTFLADAMAEAISFGEAARKAAEDGTA
jgi:hypothetical protein